MLRTLDEKSKPNWPESLDKLIYAYNCTTHDTTGYSPFFLMFGRHPKLPIDLILSDGSDEVISHESYAQKWEKQMREAYEIVQEKSAARKKKDIDRRKGDSKKILQELCVGDRVLVRNVREKGGPGKIRSHWEQKVYVIKEKKGEVVYSVLGEGEKNLNKIRVLHRNMLLPVSQWFKFQKPSKELPVRAPGKGKKVVKPKEKVETETIQQDNSDSEDEGEWFVVLRNFDRENKDTAPITDDNLKPEEQMHAGEDIVEGEGAVENGLSDGDDQTLEYDEEEARLLLEELTTGELSEHEESNIEQEIELEPEREEVENAVEIDNEINGDGEETREDRIELDSEVGEEGEMQGNDVFENRETRARKPPKKLTYEALGVPSMVELNPQNLVGNLEVTGHSTADSYAGNGQLYPHISGYGHVPVMNGQSYPNVLFSAPGENVHTYSHATADGRVPVVYRQMYPYVSSSVPNFGENVQPYVFSTVDNYTYMTGNLYPVAVGGASGQWMTVDRQDRTDRLTDNMPEFYSSNLSPSSDTFVPNSGNQWYY